MMSTLQDAPQEPQEPLETVSHAYPVVVVTGATWREEIRECAYPPCKVQFRPSRKKHVYHADGCRYLAQRKRERLEIALARGELGEAAVVQWLVEEGEDGLRRVARRVLRILDTAGRYGGEHARFRVRFVPVPGPRR